MIRNQIFLVKSYVSYWFKAKTRFKIHSPFVFDLIETVLKDRDIYPGYKEIDEYKKQLSKNKSIIETTDFGKGGNDGKPLTSFAELGKLVRMRSQQKKQARLLYRISRRFQPSTILELGTAAGFSASYIKFPVPDGKIITLEGCDSLANIARKTFDDLQIQNVEIRTGDFENSLPGTLKDLGKLDFVFIDGNHRKNATLKYFSQCIEWAHEKSLFVFDDIHWSPGMAQAWEIIKNDPRVTLSIDLFWLGLVFFRKGSPKQDFVIRY